eukprot:GHVU01122199.1.p1 GENE.GHVU01122199.1~~GHVU01122199.1.p1  ORF type:complete len:105 (-),score=15.42 GHVU01122199.1:790-1104(-)
MAGTLRYAHRILYITLVVILIVVPVSNAMAHNNNNNNSNNENGDVFNRNFLLLYCLFEVFCWAAVSMNVSWMFVLRVWGREEQVTVVTDAGNKRAMYTNNVVDD